MNTHGPSEVRSIAKMQTKTEILPEQYNNLMEKVVERENVKSALYRVKSNGGAPGVDGMDVKSLTNHIEEHWDSIKAALLNGTYKPEPVRRIEIPKPGGGTRLLGIPTVLDRLIQQEILQVLTPIYDPGFSESSYGFRPKRGCKDAIKKAKYYVNEKYDYVVDIDIEKFFDRVNHDKLMNRLKQKIGDERLLKLIRCYLKAGVMLNGVCVTTEMGTPQGGPLSPLLANIILHDLDEELERRGHRFARYADDCNIYVKSARAGARVMESVSKYIEEKLRLKVNANKSAVDRPWKRKFLGFSFTNEETKRVRIAPKSLERVKERLKQLTKRSEGISLETRIKKLNEYLVGWCNYYGYAQTPSIFERLDEWIRRRLRACLLKTWKTRTTRKRKLMSRGLDPGWAGKIGFSEKGHWRLSRTHQMHTAFGKQYWKNQGLVSLAERYTVTVHA